MIHTRILLHSLSFLILVVRVSRPVCVEVPSDTEAVLGNPMKLTCISCMKREEVNAETRVDWTYVTSNNDEIPMYLYDGQPHDVAGPFKGRLLWNGSKDLQDVSISFRNVTLNDTGTYKCEVFRQFNFDSYTPFYRGEKIINLVVREKAPQDTTALYSEIMMYVLLVFLTFWLVVEMIYCYRKISKSDEQTQDSATDYLAIPSENKENLAAPVTE
ncbi:sodium channel subunit beta-3 isoform X1 [Conger conger]|uniref:sodium channel subunit beta-3 isoform X1 n=1 Tax=Conger conger TaxID=82655 RepID=UPI002A59E985|nr:sodium channel subunit beta-3 isoform X1 [Conger conger]XP_061072172.1 sodium channel subunit beta-3 isoform X1 [Conger conger]XP_061072173.1 sodium channel subunit beta-3 isoform X1 [Conger conger]